VRVDSSKIESIQNYKRMESILSIKINPNWEVKKLRGRIGGIPPIPPWFLILLAKQ
jgi:hypothetical protein